MHCKTFSWQSCLISMNCFTLKMIVFEHADMIRGPLRSNKISISTFCLNFAHVLWEHGGIPLERSSFIYTL